MAFIVFEGGEGVGKTTQLERLHNLLTRYNYPVVKTREPGGTPLAEKIRNLFKEKSANPPLPLTEIYLLSASRHEHVKKVLEPAQKEQKIILCDRFLDSTYVYQCVVGGIDKKIVDTLSGPAIGNCIPDLTFVFYCDQNTAQTRIGKEASRSLDRYDSADLELKTKLLNGYKTLFEEQYTFPSGHLPKRVLIDATKSIDEVFAVIIAEVNQHCNLNLEL